MAMPDGTEEKSGSGIVPSSSSDQRLRLGNPEVEQTAVFLRALDIYVQRSEVRGELWKEFDLRDKVHHMRNKMARIGQFIDISPEGTEIPAEIIDEALDLINYTAFFIRQAEGETDG